MTALKYHNETWTVKHQVIAVLDVKKLERLNYQTPIYHARNQLLWLLYLS